MGLIFKSKYKVKIPSLKNLWDWFSNQCMKQHYTRRYCLYRTFCIWSMLLPRQIWYIIESRTTQSRTIQLRRDNSESGQHSSQHFGAIVLYISRSNASVLDQPITRLLVVVAALIGWEAHLLPFCLSLLSINRRPHQQ